MPSNSAGAAQCLVAGPGATATCTVPAVSVGATGCNATNAGSCRAIAASPATATPLMVGAGSASSTPNYYIGEVRGSCLR